MTSLISKPSSMFARLPAGIASAALVLGIAGFAAPATAKPIREVTLATPDEALAYCQSGKMPAGDIAYIAGGPGLAQYGPDQDCAQQVPTKGKVTKSVQVVGTKVSECKLASAKKAIAYCQSGDMGEWDIDYISGKVGLTLSGPGYGCDTGFSTSSIGNAICK
ncbi:MAG TPA: hypothetical protein VHX61_20250 [Rhizomicrobium sp.]|jgi:hypothetical protein|nr:hypothetical protein [Rhizomicrobium sp.]